MEIEVAKFQSRLGVEPPWDWEIVMVPFWRVGPNIGRGILLVVGIGVIDIVGDVSVGRAGGAVG